MIIVTQSFSNSSVFQTVFRPHENEKLTFSNSSGLKSVFGKLRFRDGLGWTGASVTLVHPRRLSCVIGDSRQPSWVIGDSRSTSYILIEFEPAQIFLADKEGFSSALPTLVQLSRSEV